jgi:hypothetical protein
MGHPLAADTLVLVAAGIGAGTFALAAAHTCAAARSRSEAGLDRPAKQVEEDSRC